MEPTWQKRQRKAQKHLEKELRARNEEEGTDVDPVRENGSKQTTVETFNQWPMFRKERKGQSR